MLGLGLFSETVAFFTIIYIRLNFIREFGDDGSNSSLNFFIFFSLILVIADSVAFVNWSLTYWFFGLHLFAFCGFFVLALTMIFAIGSIEKGQLLKQEESILYNLFWLFLIFIVLRTILATCQYWL